MPCKLTFIYHDNLGGFSESWYDNTNSAVGFPTQKIIDYLTARMAISGKEVFWDYIRCTDLNPVLARQVRIFLPSDPLLSTVSPNGVYSQSRRSDPLSADFAGTRMLVRKDSADLFQARTFFSGFPDNQVDQGGLFVPTGQFPQLFTNWQNVIQANAWGWYSRAKSNTGSPASLINLVANADGSVTLTTAPYGLNPPIFAGLIVGSNSVMRISRQLIPANLNGPLTAKIISPTVARSIKPIAFTNFVAGNGFVSASGGPTFKSVARLYVERIVKRGPGRPFGLYRGRSPNRVRG